MLREFGMMYMLVQMLSLGQLLLGVAIRVIVFVRLGLGLGLLFSLPGYWHCCCCVGRGQRLNRGRKCQSSETGYELLASLYCPESPGLLSINSLGTSQFQVIYEVVLLLSYCFRYNLIYDFFYIRFPQMACCSVQMTWAITQCCMGQYLYYFYRIRLKKMLLSTNCIIAG